MKKHFTEKDFVVTEICPAYDGSAAVNGKKAGGVVPEVSAP
jgi:hypothetical protein